MTTIGPDQLPDGNVIDYIPDVLDCRDQAARGADDVFTVQITVLTGEESNRIEIAQGKITGRDVNFVKRGNKARQRLFAKNIVAVKNLNVTKHDGEVISPKTGSELYSLCMSPILDDTLRSLILDDIEKAIRDISHANEGLLKNLKTSAELTTSPSS
tara:strand:- start:136 stop:606 length:471 start_codon:yes stop_codon:yes gene_type:complete